MDKGDVKDERAVRFDGNEANVHAGHRRKLRESARRDIELNGLRDTELIELLLSFFVPRKDTNVLAHKLIDRFGSAAGVLCADKADLLLFPGITARMAALLPLLGNVCRISDGDFTIKSRRDGVNFFGSLFADGEQSGTYVVYLDGDFRVIAIEQSDGNARDVLRSLCKYDGKYVFIARREADAFPQTFGLAGEVADLAYMISAVGGRLLDYIMFVDNGYYTIGEPPKAEGWALYIFIPAKRFMFAPDLYDRVTAEAFADEISAEPIPDIIAQLGKIAIECD